MTCNLLATNLQLTCQQLLALFRYLVARYSVSPRGFQEGIIGLNDMPYSLRRAFEQFGYRCYCIASVNELADQYSTSHTGVLVL